MNHVPPHSPQPMTSHALFPHSQSGSRAPSIVCPSPPQHQPNYTPDSSTKLPNHSIPKQYNFNTTVLLSMRLSTLLVAVVATMGTLTLAKDNRSEWDKVPHECQYCWLKVDTCRKVGCVLAYICAATLIRLTQLVCSCARMAWRRARTSARSRRACSIPCARSVLTSCRRANTQSWMDDGDAVCCRRRPRQA